MEVARAEEVARATIDVGHFSARVSASDRSEMLGPLAAHLASLPEPEDVLATPRGAGAALITVTGGFAFDTELREHAAGHIRTMAFRIADSHSIAYDSAGDDSASAPPGGRRTVWHFRFTGGQIEIAGHAVRDGGDEAEEFARRLAQRIGGRS